MKWLNDRANILGTVALVFAGALVAFCAYDLSPLIDWPGIDGAVFIYVARSMREGLLPYLDVFDHKGPMIYIFNWIGLAIDGGGVRGIWMLDVALFAISLAYAVKWIKRLYGAVSVGLFAVVYFSLLVWSAQGGNVTETWAIYFIIPIVVNMVKRIEGCGTVLDDLFVGVSISIILLLRPNMLVCGIVYCLHVLIDAVSRRDAKLFAMRTAMVVAGMAAVLAPVLIWLGYSGALSACWRDYITFNLSYLSSESSNEAVNPRLWHSAILIGITGLIGFGIAKDGKKSFWWMFAACLLSWAIVAMKTSFSHYFVVLSAPIGLFAAVCAGWNRWKVFARLVFAFASIWLLYFFACGTVFHVVHLPSVKENISKREMPTSIKSILWDYNEKYDRLVEFAPMIKDKNSVLVLGNDCTVYEKLGARSKTRYPYQSPITRISIEIHDDVANAITNGVDRYIICSKDYSEFPIELMPFAPYKAISETDEYSLFERIEDEDI